MKEILNNVWVKSDAAMFGGSGASLAFGETFVALCIFGVGMLIVAIQEFFKEAA